MKKGTTYRIEVNSDKPIAFELIAVLEWLKKADKKRYLPESSRPYAKNVDILFPPRRNGDWVVYIRNLSRGKQQVGVRVSEEPSD